MSDFEHSTVTYTLVPSSVEDYSDIESPEVDGPLSSDYVPGPEEPEQAPLSPNNVPGPEEPEQAPLSLDYVPDPEEPKQALLSLDYVPGQRSQSRQHPHLFTYLMIYSRVWSKWRSGGEDPKEDPADYPADSTVVALPAVDHVSSEEVTEPLPQIPSPPLPIPSPPDSPTHIEISESCLPLRKRLHTWDELVGASEEIAPTTLQGVNQRVTDLSTIVEQETTIMYGMMEEAQDDRSQLRG
nr:hypothetical protein [Tanacetum cinerariifolium]